MSLLTKSWKLFGRLIWPFLSSLRGRGSLRRALKGGARWAIKRWIFYNVDWWDSNMKLNWLVIFEQFLGLNSSFCHFLVIGDKGKCLLPITWRARTWKSWTASVSRRFNHLSRSCDCKSSSLEREAGWYTIALLDIRLLQEALKGFHNNLNPAVKTFEKLKGYSEMYDHHWCSMFSVY